MISFDCRLPTFGAAIAVGGAPPGERRVLRTSPAPIVEMVAPTRTVSSTALTNGSMRVHRVYRLTAAGPGISEHLRHAGWETPDGECDQR